MNLIFLDFETTGISEKEDRIIEIGAIKTDLDLNIIDTYHTLINPGIYIPAFITQLTNGIDNELVKDKPILNDIKDSFTSFISNNPIISHNAEFEKKFINANFKKISNVYLDTMDLFVLFFPDSSNLKLDTFIRILNLRTNGELHRAYEDALDLYKVLLFIKENIKTNYKFNSIAKRLVSTFSKKEYPWHTYVTYFLKNTNIDEKNVIKNFNNFKDEILISVDKNLNKDELLSTLNSEDLEERSEQKEYLSYITEAINDNKNLAIEAGTGTGKTLAYLIPAIKYTLDNNKTVVIATKTKALQQQIVNNDLDLAKKLLSIKDYDALKVQGRNNYLCIRKLDKFFSSFDLLDDFETRFAKLFFYAFDKLSSLGDLTLIPTWIKNKFEYIDTSVNLLSSDINTCILSRCAFYNDCHYFNMIRLARKSKLLIANHSLVFNWPMHLLRGEKIIYDEAHQLEKEATNATLETASNYELKKLLLSLIDVNKNRGLLVSLKNSFNADEYSLINNLVQDSFILLEKLDICVKDLFLKFESLKDKKFDFKYAANIFLYSKDFIYGDLNILKEQTWNNLVSYLSSLYLNINKLITYIETNKNIFNNDDDKILVLSVIEKLTVINSILNKTINLSSSSDKENIFYIDFFEKTHTWSINKAILDLASFLNASIYPMYKTNIFTSATLGSDAKFYGLDKIIKLKSPFNYEKNSKFCFLSNSMFYNNPNFVKTLGLFIIEILKISNGKTLVLFSSWYRLEKVYEYIAPILDKLAFKVYKQTKSFDSVENFKTSEKAVLLGTESFAEGLDIKGDKLSVVILEGAPTIIRDSIYVAREKNYSLSKDKKLFELEKRILKLKQWSGRLIRSKTDKGIVIVFDNWYSKLSAHYKSIVNSELSHMPISYIDKEDFMTWFKDNFFNL